MILDALRDARAVLFPVDCAGCGRDGRALCESCARALEPVLTPRASGGLRVLTALRYESVVRRVILAFKEEGRTDVARALARPLAAAVDGVLEQHPECIVVPVPASRDGFHRRGYDPVPLLLRRAGVDSIRALRVDARGSAQKTLSVRERAENVSGTMLARPSVAGRRVVLVDDVLTTGATLAEAARAVAAADGQVVAAVGLAFTPRSAMTRDIDGGDDYGGAKGA